MTYTVHLPVVYNNYTPPNSNPNKGIALVENYLQDLDSVGATWYYTWTPYPKPKEDSRYVPMSYYGLFDDDLPVDYDGFVLFLNEPNNPAPFGANISPQLAAERYAAFVIARPKAKLVVGNTSAWASQWHYDFIHEIIRFGNVPSPHYVGIHGYVEEWLTPDVLGSMWNNIYLGYKAVGIIPEIWITEFADTVGDTESLTALINVIKDKSYITKYSYFTNRYDPEAAYIPINWKDFNLIKSDGSLTNIGEIYSKG